MRAVSYGAKPSSAPLNTLRSKLHKLTFPPLPYLRTACLRVLYSPESPLSELFLAKTLLMPPSQFSPQHISGADLLQLDTRPPWATQRALDAQAEPTGPTEAHLPLSGCPSGSPLPARDVGQRKSLAAQGGGGHISVFLPPPLPDTLAGHTVYYSKGGIWPAGQEMGGHCKEAGLALEGCADPVGWLEPHGMQSPTLQLCGTPSCLPRPSPAENNAGGAKS